MKKFLSVMSISLLFTSLAFAAASSENPFSDLSDDHENYDAILYVYEQGIVSGYDDGTYRASEKINRAEFTKIVIEAIFDETTIENCDVQTYTRPDVVQDSWYAPHVCVALENGIVNGYDDGTYGPSNKINFAEAAKIVVNSYDMDLRGRDDVWYEPYVVTLEHVNGIPLSIDSFDQELDRGEFAEIIYRVDAGITDKDTETFGSLNGTGPAVADNDTDSSGPGAPVSTDYTDGETETIASLSLPSSDYFGEYSIEDEDFGTEVSVTLSSNSRQISANALPNHETGEFPNSGNPNTISAQSTSYHYPLTGNYTGEANWVQIPGVAVNGVKFEPETAENVTCSSGETHKIEALQDTYDLGFDLNNAHVQPDGTYHYHGFSSLLADLYDENEDLIHMGFAADGHMIYYDTSGTVESSWEIKTEEREGTGCTYKNQSINIDGTTPDGTYVSDWEFNADSGNLDACNGAFIDGEYAYFITDEYPFIGRCMQGETSLSKMKKPLKLHN